jgi:hypothetical protein
MLWDAVGWPGRGRRIAVIAVIARDRRDRKSKTHHETRRKSVIGTSQTHAILGWSGMWWDGQGGGSPHLEIG